MDSGLTSSRSTQRRLADRTQAELATQHARWDVFSSNRRPDNQGISVSGP